MNNIKRFNLWKSIRNLFLVFIAALLAIAITHNGLKIYEKNKYEPPGKLVEVDQHRMHVYSKGEGAHTIVLLSGAGTASPVLDFEPLIRQLSKTNKVVVVEPFGYGWSDQTTEERTVENIVEEIRKALQKAEINGPYILMPHSISGIYSMYYVNKYPNEIEAIIGIEPTLPKMLDYFGESAPKTPKLMSMVSPMGLGRLEVKLNTENYLPIAEEGTYSDANLKATKILSSWNIANKNVISEGNAIEDNIKKTLTMSFPAELPVMIFTKKGEKLNQESKNNITFYESELSHLETKKIIPLEGHHYLHWTNYKVMSNKVQAFLGII